MSKTTEAQARATKKYQSRVYTQICYKIRKDFKTAIENHTQKTGETVNGFITRAINNQIAIDNKSSENDPD